MMLLLKDKIDTVDYLCFRAKTHFSRMRAMRSPQAHQTHASRKFESFDWNLSDEDPGQHDFLTSTGMLQRTDV
jgi:hypothetical protein